MQRASEGTARLVALRSALSAYASAAFDSGDIVEVRLVPSGRSSWCRADELPRFAEPLIRANDYGENIYIGANPRSRYGGTETADVANARCLFADFDHMSVVETIKMIEAMQMPSATLLISSGHGCHAYWRLLTPIARLDIWREWQLDLIGLLGTDHKIHDPPRVMRLPGFLNNKHVPHVPCEILDCDPCRIYDLADLPIPMRVGTGDVPPLFTVRRINSEVTDGNRVARCRAYVAKMPNAISGSHGHDATYAVACQCNRFGLSKAEAMDLMRWFNTSKCDPAWSEKELGHKVDDAYRKNAPEHGLKLREQRMPSFTVQRKRGAA